MVKISVRNYRGIARADIECAPIALLNAEVGSGKSSIAQAAAACLTGLALDGRLELSKGKAGQVLHLNAPDAAAYVATDAGTARMTWPECALETKGDAPHATPFAAGLMTVTNMSLKDRSAALEPYLKASPTLADLQAAMSEQFKPESIAALWAELEQRGWDATAANYEQRRRETSRDWSKLTGVTFGSEKAGRWRPGGWDDELADIEVDALRKRVADARAAVDRAIASTAVADAELLAWNDQSNALGERQKALADAEAALRAAEKAESDARAARAAIPDATDLGMACPHCGGLITFKRDLAGATQTIEKFEPISYEEKKDRRSRISAADGTLSSATAQRGAAMRSVAAAKEAVAASQTARQKIKAAAEKPSAKGAVSLPDARANLAACEANLNARVTNDDAATLFREWRRANLIFAVVAPSGLRARKLGDCVDAFNSGVLAPLCETAGWPPITLDAEMMAGINGRAYTLCSEGEKWQARTILQIAQAKLDGSDMIIIDNLPDLDSASLNGIIRVLADGGIPALICACTRKGVPIPDLAAAGLGGTWLIKDGKTSRLAAGPAEDDQQAAQ